MRNTFLAVLLCLCGIVVYGQEFKNGTQVISANIGLGSSLDVYNSANGGIGISANYERGFWEAGPGTVSLGGYIGRVSYDYSGGTGGYHYEQKWNYTIIGVRGAWHYSELDVENLDVYAGVLASINILDYKYTDSEGTSDDGIGSYGSYPGVTPFAGGRYYFTKNFAANAEVGYGVSFLQLGISYRF